MENRHRRHHILLITYPAQGHINPSLHLAERLLNTGMQVTFTTSISGRRCMPTTLPNGLRLNLFSNGYDDGIKNKADSDDFYVKLRSCGTQNIKETIISSAEQCHPVTCLVYTIFFPWVAEVARGFHLPTVLFWIQPAAVLDIYYYYFHGYGEEIDKHNDPSWSIKLRGLPLLHKNDLPSFLFPSTQETYKRAISSLREHFDALNDHPKVLVNSFDDLECDALRAIHKLNMVAIGPVIPSDNFLKENSYNDHDQDTSKNYINWLNTKEDSSVIYISFGTMLVLPKQEMEEIASGLIKTKRPFLWIMRKNEYEYENQEQKLECMSKLEEQGMIVPWCSQIEVLSHKAIGCFVTHCGWNSTLESLALGVAVVAYPKWTDQGTIAKMIEDVWKTGVRVKGSEEGNVCGDDIYTCLEMVMGGEEKREELRRNAEKWKGLAREAVTEGGSSYNNLRAFVEEF